MPLNDESLVWNNMVAIIRDWMSDRGYGSNSVYLVEAPIDESISQVAVQIVPVSDTAKHPMSGVGLIETTFEINLWWRSMFDPVNRATSLIAGAAGAEQFQSGIRQLLIQNDLDGSLTVPVVFTNGGRFEAIPELDGWLRATEVYTMAYEIPWVS
jgi:hypothetical protein